MPKMYGNLMNRLGEGRNYTNRELKVGDDITMYLWSDRQCYYITEVISQKEIKVKQYHVCADRSKPGGMGHQDWLYFKTLKEENDYLLQYFPDRGEVDIPEPEPETWVYRYNKWQGAYSRTLKDWNECIRDLQCAIENLDSDKAAQMAQRSLGLTDNEVAKIKNGGAVRKYYDLSGKVSFGVRSYYYDWEF